MALSQQAQNCLMLFEGASPFQIEKALKSLNSSVLAELKTLTQSNNIQDCAFRLSTKAY